MTRSEAINLSSSKTVRSEGYISVTTNNLEPVNLIGPLIKLSQRHHKNVKDIHHDEAIDEHTAATYVFRGQMTVISSRFVSYQLWGEILTIVT